MNTSTRKPVGWRGWLVISSSGLLVALILALVWLFYTQSGLAWSLERAKAWLPGELEITQVDGRLAGPVHLHGLQYRDEELTLDLDSLTLEWRLGLLVLGIAQVDRLSLDGLRLQLPAGEEAAEAEAFELPEAIRLPLRVHLRELTASHLHVRPAPGAEAFEIDRLQLSASGSGHHLDVDALAAEGPWFQLEAGGELDMVDDWPLSLAARWSLNWPELPAMEGETRLSGDRQRLELDQHLDGPLVLRASGELRQPLEDLRVRLDLRFRDLVPSELLADAPGGRLAGQLRLSGGMESARLRGQVDASDTPWGDLNLDTELSAPLSLDWLRIHALRLEHHQHPMVIEARGELQQPLSDDPEGELALAWAHLSWPLDIPEYVSDSGHAEWRGRLSDYQLELDTRFAWFGQTPQLQGPLSAELSTVFQGRQDQARIDRLALAIDEGPQLDFRGEVDWADTGSFLDGAFQLADFDPGRFAEDWPGLLAARGHVHVAWRDEVITGALDLESLSGTLAGRSLEGRGGLGWEDETLRLDDVFLAFGEDELQADGHLALDPQERDSELDFRLRLPDLSRWPLDLAGSLHASGRLAGRLDSANLNLSLTADDLAHDTLFLDELQLEVDIVEGGQGESRLALSGEGLHFQDQTIERLRLQGDGRRHDHRLSLQAEHELLHFGLSLAGGLDEALHWTGELIDTRLENATLGRWQQREHRTLSFGPEGGRLEEVCLNGLEQAGELCLDAEFGGDGRWQARLDGRDFPLAMFLDPEETGMDVEGMLGLHLEAGDEGDGVTARGRVDFSPGQIRQSVDGQPVTLMAIDGGEAQFDWTPERADGELALRLDDGGHLQASARLPSGIEGPLQGRLDASIPQLGLLPVLVPEVGRAQGRLSLAVDIDGRLDDPQFSGDVRIIDAELSLPDLGITTEAVNLHVTGGMHSLNLVASARSGDGEIHFDADLDRLGGDWQGGARLQGEDFLVFNTPDARVRINPDLQLMVSPGNRLDVSGDLHVPWARITPRDLRATVQVSPDEVLMGEFLRDEEAPGDWSLFSRVRTSLGDDVHFDGYGLTGNITGALSLRDEPGALTRATGDLEIVDGQYEAWRQRLTVERGRLFYSDTPVSDPGLDIRAVRRPRNVVVGVNIRGTLRQPELELFSDPPMQQSEQLSYLLTGHSLIEGGEGDMNLVREATMALQMAGGGYVGRRLGDRLGVDTVTIEAGDSPEEAAVFFGEYLSPRLFISYGIGLFESTNVFRIRYEISSRWFLEAQTGPRSGADFIYSLERG